jgi:probable F420-dependent oxidoreductase
MKFGIVSIFPPARSALEKLRLAERLGFDTFWVCDSHVIWNECYSLLGWLIGQSRDERIEFGTMVTNPVSRDPIVVASAFATLQDLTDGRMLCGIGRGDSAVRVLKRRPAKLKDFEPAVEMMKALACGDEATIETGSVQIEWASGARVPVYVAAYGPKMMQLAGRVADGVIIECADPHYIAWAVERVHRGAEEAGRDPSELHVISSTATFISDDIELAREQVRPLGAVVGNHVAEVLRNNGRDSLPPELEAFIAERPDYDYLHHVRRDVGQSNYVPDEIIDRLCLIGSPDHCAERVRELAGLGVTHVNFYAQTDDFDRQMGIWAESIIPQLRNELPVSG